VRLSEPPRPLEKAQGLRPLQRLTLEAMIDVLSTHCSPIPETRQPDRGDYRLHDTLMRGFARMFLQHASLLALQRKMPQRRGRCHLETLCGVHEVPSDTQRREIVEGVPVEWLRQVWPERLAQGRRVGWAKACHRTGPRGSHPGEYYSARRDGSDYLHSTTGHCPGG
jgi:hypothetical protein